MLSKVNVFRGLALIVTSGLFAQPIIIDHHNTDITTLPQSAIEQAKSTLHIAYGHTSHGSQVTTGMSSLVGFANGGGKGLSLPTDIFAWNNGGSGGALDLHDYAMGGDVGYYPDWVNNTRTYLDNSANADCNVIMWSWCGQASSRTEATMLSTYLEPMTQLESEYPGVKFVYMTGHSDGTGETGNLHLRNQQIRNYCIANNKILYDFYDIECYDPDGNYYGDKLVNDNCDYDSDNNGTRDANWATAWQGSHTENVDWYSCSAAHSQSLNGNQKAYAAWWLFASIAGYDQSLSVEMNGLFAEAVSDQCVRVSWRTASETDCAGFHIWRGTDKNQPYERITQAMILGRGNSSESHEYEYADYQVDDGKSYWYKIEEISTDGTSTEYGPVFVSLIENLPDAFGLLQNYPNPFNASTVFQFILPEQGQLTVRVFDNRGRLVETIKNEFYQAGYHEIRWDSGNLPSGIYYAQAQSTQFSGTRKILLMK